MCWDPLLEGGGHPTPRGAWRPPSVERAGLVQGSVGDGNPGSGSRVCAGSAGAGRGVAGENVVGLLPWKQRTSLSLPVNRLLPEAGGIEGPVLSLSLPVPTTGENSCFQGRQGCGQDVPVKLEASILLSAQLLRAEGPGAHLLSRPFSALEEGCWMRS